VHYRPVDLAEAAVFMALVWHLAFRAVARGDDDPRRPGPEQLSANR
jgi:hypothetical protein